MARRRGMVLILLLAGVLTGVLYAYLTPHTRAQTATTFVELRINPGGRSDAGMATLTCGWHVQCAGQF